MRAVDSLLAGLPGEDHIRLRRSRSGPPPPGASLRQAPVADEPNLSPGDDQPYSPSDRRSSSPAILKAALADGTEQ